MIQNRNKQRNITSNRTEARNIRIITLCIMIASFFFTHCSATPEERMPEPSNDIRESNTAPEAKVPVVELSEKDKQEIDTKIEKLKKLPIKNLIENYQKTKDYEEKQSLAAIEEVINRKLLVLLKKEFPDSKDVLELPIYDPTGTDNYFKLVLKDLFILYISQNPKTGATITKESLNLKRNKKAKTVEVFIYPPGARQSQEITFRIFNGKLILSSYRAGMEVNPTGYEYLSSEIIAMLSLKENGYMPALDSINQKQVDSIK